MRGGPTATRPPQALRACPGCRVRQVQGQLPSCRSCWDRVPKQLRDRVDVAYRVGTARELGAAVRHALEWFRRNPAGVPVKATS